MVLIIFCAQVLLMCARGAEPKIVYSRPVQLNDTAAAMGATAAAVATEPASAADMSVKADNHRETSTTTAATAAAAAAMATAAAAAMAAATAAATSAAAETSEADASTATATTTTTATTAEQASAGRRYADSNKSMSTKINNYYGVRLYAPPPVVHHGADVLFGRPIHPPPSQHRLQLHHRPAAYYQQHPHHLHRPPTLQWDPTMVPATANNAGNDDGATQPILVNPLLAAYEDPSTVRYASARHHAQTQPQQHQQQPQHRGQSPAARLIRYTAEPAAAVQAFQLPPYLHAGDPGDRALLETLPAIRFALHHAAGRTQPQAAAAAAAAASATDALLQQYALQSQPLAHHHAAAAAIKQQPSPVAPGTPHHQHHQLHFQPHHHLHHHHQRLSSAPALQLPPPHHLYAHHHHHATQPHQLHHRYGVHPPRYTQVPFLYNLPAPPPSSHHHQQHRPLAPAEYDLVTRFNRLLKERERDDVRAAAAAAAAAADEEEEDEASGGAVEPTSKPRKTKKRKKKKRRRKRPRPATTPAPAPVEEEPDEEPDDRHQLQQHQADDERTEDDQPVSEEQESQYIHTSERLPAGTIVHETEDHLQNVIDEPAQLTEQFGGDLTFEDSDGERVEFQLHGLGGPESYKFGYDTGKGTNRQFRYEERDSEGNVRGHYGYKDSDGKMQVYNYSSHPEYGFHAEKAEAPPETPPEE